jgi:hypothetical protein
MLAGEYFALNTPTEVEFPAPTAGGYFEGTLSYAVRIIFII